MSRVVRDESGFTLPELLMAILVTSIILPVLSAALVVGFRTTAGTTDALAASNDAELTSTWFVPDVQSADAVSGSDEPTCKSPGATPADRLLTLKHLSGTATVITGYATVTSGSSLTMVRYSCTDGTPMATLTINHSLSARPVVTCLPGPCGSTTTQVSIASTDSTGYSFTLTAKRRTA